ncbi:hypothetical protein Taro_000913 [Colocasia esculenta]|uniref:Uncharacterized protein n=1 Tax=Colocasia esculenta TaxID=4460 RepID=A0A843TJ68_COLES|nr:hypothetical protein [Colocasia esculenta]
MAGTSSLRSSSRHPLPLILLPPSLASISAWTMPPKKTPRRGARSRATAIEEPPTERRSKRLHDPTGQPDLSSPSPTPSKRGGMPSSSCGSSQRQSHHPRRKILSTSPEPSEASSSTSSGSSQSSDATPSKVLSEGKSILKPRAVDLTDEDFATTFLDVSRFFKFQGWPPFISEFRTFYPRLVQEFYKNLTVLPEGYQSEVKGVSFVLSTELASTLFKVLDESEDSFKKTSNIANKAKDKCFMALGSSRSSPSSDKSERSYLLEKSRNSQRSEDDISYDELIECYEHLSNQFNKVKAQSKKLKEKLDRMN